MDGRCPKDILNSDLYIPEYRKWIHKNKSCWCGVELKYQDGGLHHDKASGGTRRRDNKSKQGNYQQDLGCQEKHLSYGLRCISPESRKGQDRTSGGCRKHSSALMKYRTPWRTA